MTTLDNLGSPHQIDFAAQRQDKLRKEADAYRLGRCQNTPRPPTRRYLRRRDR